MNYNTLEEVIRSQVPLRNKNSEGWESCLHTGCDHGRKGDRAAFLFRDGKTIFHCFNCDVRAIYDPNVHDTIHPNFVKILQDFNIHEDSWQSVLLGSLSARDNGTQLAHHNKQHSDIEPKEIELPTEFYLLDSADEDDAWAIIARDYLNTQRMIDPSSYPFMLSARSDKPETKKWRGRLIYPIYKQGKLVFYQGRDLTNKQAKKYESPAACDKSKVLYDFDQLFRQTNAPLYVVEGWFDAHLLSGIAVFGNTITDVQVAWLNKSQREKIYIPDRFGNGKKVAERALDLGWKVSIPYENSWDSSIKDVTDIIKCYGKLYTMKQIVDNTTDGLDARVRLNTICM